MDFLWLLGVKREKTVLGEDERYFDSDCPHNFTTVLSYKPNRYWSFGLNINIPREIRIRTLQIRKRFMMWIQTPTTRYTMAPSTKIV